MPEITQFRALPGAQAVDAEKGIIRGVSVMTLGPALGHGILIDQKGLDQCLAACKSHGDEGVKLIAKHDGQLDDIVGAVRNFRIEGNQILGDAYLLDTAPQRARVLELAAKLPKEFGLSVETTGQHEPAPNKKQKFYRCDGIDAIALVSKPAANPSGLFEAVDNPENTMTEEQLQAAIKAAVDPLVSELSGLKTELASLKTESATKLSAGDVDKAVETKLAARGSEIALDAVTKFAAGLGVKKAPDAPAEPQARGVTKFEAKVEEMAKAGTRNPFFAAVNQFPELYNEYRAKQEGR
jgi:hypothetical protein